jgi:hypothetical protein
MNQIQPIPKYILKFVAIKDNKPVEFNFTFTIPSVQQPPVPGDEIQLPEKITSVAGFTKTVFKIQSRRFLFDSLEPGIAGIIYLSVA